MERTIRYGILAWILLLTAQAAASAQGGRAMLEGPVEPIRFSADPMPLRGWATGEYLYWWVRDQPAPGPLVTTGDPNSQYAGFLTDSTTTVLFGDRKIGYGGSSGARFTVGMWIDDESITGIEFTGFYLQPRDTSFKAASDPTGVPILGMPGTTSNGGPSVLYAASNGNQLVANLKGSIEVNTTSRFIGAELNTVFNAWRVEGDVLDLVIGLRYLDLQESLETGFQSTALRFDGNVVGNDTFNTRNHFLGAQVGARWTGTSGRLSASLAGLIGLGGTNQIVGIDGTTTLSGTALAIQGSLPGFLYTQPTNIGRYQHTVFSAVPQVQAKLGYNLLSNVRLTFGYDFLCWTNAARASQQIDHVMNLTQYNPVLFPGGKSSLNGEARPRPLLNDSNFWAQGITGGIELRW